MNLPTSQNPPGDPVLQNAERCTRLYRGVMQVGNNIFDTNYQKGSAPSLSSPGNNAATHPKDCSNMRRERELLASLFDTNDGCIPCFPMNSSVQAAVRNQH